MCGIAGILTTDLDVSLPVKEMVASMKHRGPDDRGLYCHRGVALGHSRLSIIDLSSSGHQPMYNTDKSLVLIFNGEIYNYIELREKLKLQGIPFHSDSDSEVLLNLYELKREKMLEDLIGMFAFVIYDIKNEELFIARDPIGKKPLYYFFQDNILVFASEIQALRHVSTVEQSLTLNHEAVWHYFSLLYVPQPMTIFNEIKVFPAGHYGIYRKGNLMVEKYWEPIISIKKWDNIDQCGEELSKILDSAVAWRMRSDVPYGAYLSGGIDSTIVVSKMVKSTNEQIKTFTATIHDNILNENQHAAMVADKFCTKHTTLDVNGINFDLINTLLKYFGQPFADSSLLPTYLISQKIREYVTVVLGGDGGDEFFSGYDKYFKLLQNNSDEAVEQAFINRVPAGVKEFIFSRQFSSAIKQKSTFQFLISSSVNKNYRGYDLLKFLDIEFFLKGDILPKIDHMSMANALEARTPLLDRRVMDFALSVPQEFLVSKERNKILLKLLVEEFMPKEFVNRPKVGFMLPIADWMRKIAPEISQLELPNSIRSFFDKEQMGEIIKEYQNGKDEFGYLLFGYVVFVYWAQIYFPK